MPTVTPKDKPRNIRRRNSKGVSIRIHLNGWGNWEGFIDHKWTISFSAVRYKTAEQAAHAWLEENSK